MISQASSLQGFSPCKLRCRSFPLGTMLLFPTWMVNCSLSRTMFILDMTLIMLLFLLNGRRKIANAVTHECSKSFPANSFPKSTWIRKFNGKTKKVARPPTELWSLTLGEPFSIYQIELTFLYLIKGSLNGTYGRVVFQTFLHRGNSKCSHFYFITVVLISNNKKNEKNSRNSKNVYLPGALCPCGNCNANREWKQCSCFCLYSKEMGR